MSRFTQGETDDRLFTHYHAQVVPWLWFLTRQADCRIFQNLAVPDIISQVFNLFDFKDFRLSLKGSYPQLEYCVQYRETSFNFVSRLMEEFGIFYYFDHSTQGKHTMVLADQSSTLPACPSSPVSYDTRGRRPRRSRSDQQLARRTGSSHRQVHGDRLQFHDSVHQFAGQRSDGGRSLRQSAPGTF